MAVIHELEKKFYGPTSGLDRNSRVLLMIRHQTIGNGWLRVKMGRTVIEEYTGLCKQEVTKAIKKLIKDELILVETRQINKVWQDSIYQLHPKTFGTQLIWRETPTFQVIPGGKCADEDIPTVPRSGQRGYPPIGVEGYTPIVPHQTSGNEPLERVDAPLKTIKECIKKGKREKVTFFEETKVQPSDEIKQLFPQFFKQTKSSK